MAKFGAVNSATEHRASIVTEGGHVSHVGTYISGTGTAGTDNTAMTLMTIAIAANAITQVGDRMRVRVYWKGDTGPAVTGTIKLNTVTIGDTTDGGGASFNVGESWLHYIDNTHANIIEMESGALGAVSAVNVAGFAWASSQDLIFTQSAAVGNRAVLYAIIIDIFPKGV